ncbi:MAG TPA: histidine phosphatase family protein [Anaerolineales bacterium]|nr:histidine phosphatase family protein [Anaerolineales bacterium]
MTTRLILVRHGRTSYNAEWRFMGQLDIPLDEVGRLQAQAVAKRLSVEAPIAIYASGLSRAVDTANAIRASIAAHPDLRLDARLTEGHFGVWQGETYQSVKVHDASRLAQWEADRLNVSPPDGESLPQIAQRVQAAYADICEQNRGETAIIVAHGGSLQVLVVLALGLPLESYWKMWITNASVSELHIDESGAMLHLLNDTSHLKPDN